MSGVDDIQRGIAAAAEKANASVAALQQAQQQLEEALQILSQVTAGSSQPEVMQALGMYEQAARGIGEQQNTVQGAIQSAESYAQRL